MVLSKKAFHTELARAFKREGWLEMPGPKHESILLARREGQFVLSLGCYESNLHADTVTAELALGEHASLMSFPDAPHASCRVGEFLHGAERKRLLDERYSRAGVVDAWWTGRTDENVAKIVEAVRLAAPRFLATPDLVEEIVRSPRHRAYADKLRTIAATEVPADHRGEQPPENWMVVAESLTTAPVKKRPAIAARWAADAWRTFRLLGLDRDRSDLPEGRARREPPGD